MTQDLSPRELAAYRERLQTAAQTAPAAGPALTGRELADYQQRLRNAGTPAAPQSRGTAPPSAPSTRTIDPTAGTVRTLDATRTVTTTTLTDDQLAELRAELGPDLTAAEVQPRWERHGDLRLVALEVVRERLAALLAGPATFTVPGVYSQSTAPNLTAYREQLARLSAPDALAAATPKVVRHRTTSRRGR